MDILNIRLIIASLVTTLIFITVCYFGNLNYEGYSILSDTPDYKYRIILIFIKLFLVSFLGFLFSGIKLSHFSEYLKSFLIILGISIIFTLIFMYSAFPYQIYNAVEYIVVIVFTFIIFSIIKLAKAKDAS